MSTVRLVPVDTGNVLQRYDVTEDDVFIGHIARERRLPDNPLGVWAAYDSVGEPIEEGDENYTAAQAVVANYAGGTS